MAADKERATGGVGSVSMTLHEFFGTHEWEDYGPNKQDVSDGYFWDGKQWIRRCIVCGKVDVFYARGFW